MWQICLIFYNTIYILYNFFVSNIHVSLYARRKYFQLISFDIM